MIRITPSIAIAEDELELTFVYASGPGGQNVNKTATACQLRFHVRTSLSLQPAVKRRLIRLAGQQINVRGELIIQARRFRSQYRNRLDAVARLKKLIQRAAITPKPRNPTRPTRASVKKRLETKRKLAEKKNRRQLPKSP